MATEQYLSHTVLQTKTLEDDVGSWKASSIGTDINSSGGFDCNICLDSVQDPVVTLCGHLYCWPCIYKWIQQQSNSPEIPEDQKPQCPVCKAEVSERTLIPLYGRDQPMKGSDDESKKIDTVIPCRPKGPACGVHATTMMGRQQDARYHRRYPPYQAQPPAYYPYHGGYYEHDTSAPAITLAGSTTFHPLISMFGDMICTRFFGNSQSFYTYPSSYSVAATSSARARRHTMQADRSLSRLSFFLLCCLVLCLVLF